MTTRRVALVVILVPFALIAVTGILFVLNGLLLCDGDTPRAGAVTASSPALAPNTGQLRVLSYNVAKCFVCEGRVAGRREVESRLTTIARVIREANADVVCLAEIVREFGPCNIDQVTSLSRDTGLTNWAFGENFSFGIPFFRIVSGNAIISRYPVAPRANLTLTGRKPFYVTMNNRRALACLIATPFGELPFWALHNDTFNMSNNLAQVKQILAHPLSTNSFLAGDFNSQPADPPLHLIEESRRFSGVFDGPFTFSSTEPVRTIDFVLAPRSWTVREHRVISNAVSDHCAVLTVFGKD